MELLWHLVVFLQAQSYTLIQLDRFLKQISVKIKVGLCDWRISLRNIHFDRGSFNSELPMLTRSTKISIISRIVHNAKFSERLEYNCSTRNTCLNIYKLHDCVKSHSLFNILRFSVQSYLFDRLSSSFYHPSSSALILYMFIMAIKSVCVKCHTSRPLWTFHLTIYRSCCQVNRTIQWY